MSYVDAETDADLDDERHDDSPGEHTPETGKVLPWPGSGGGTPGEVEPKDGPGTPGRTGVDESAPPTGESAGATPSLSTAAEEEQSDVATVSIRLRSDDWLAGEPAHELEECYLALTATSSTDLDRFAADLPQDRGCSLVQATLGMVGDALRSSLREDDRADLTDLLERALYDAIAVAGWADARQVFDGLTELTEGRWDAAPLIDRLARADSPVSGSLVRYLDERTIADLTEFVAFAHTLGPVAITWLMSLLARASQEPTRRTLVQALTEFCEGNPALVAPWLTDERWHVVRNAVCIIGTTAGGAIPALLHPLVDHPEPCVRREVIVALANTPIDAARPLLIALIEDSDASNRRAVLHRLGSERHPEVSAALLRIVRDPDFRRRPVEEVRSVTTALGGCAGDEALPDLEQQLYAPGWFNNWAAPHCQMIARCIIRIGTPAAVALLERNASSRVAATRDACRLVLRATKHA